MPTLEKTRPAAKAERVPSRRQAAASRHALPAHEASGEDRRITRTRAALRQALIELMEERGLEAITVNDLCTRAGLTRGTFYNHYQDKDALLAAFEQEVLDGLVSFERRLGDLDMETALTFIVQRRPLPLLVDIFDYLRDQGDFLHAALGPGGDVCFGPLLRDSLCTQIVESILHQQYRDNPTAFVGYYVAFYASAYLGVITRWVQTGMRETSDEMALISERLLFIQPGESIEL
ncbi:MAG: TetR/AcrR family transcriptional regulator [Coriobacteriaceae bacterium]|nr:TetR/AcrR family transcriptional regulator [Coriobacteriaceae bacterium]